MTLRSEMQRRVEASRANPNVQAAFEQCVFLMGVASDTGALSCTMDLCSRHLSEDEFEILVTMLKSPKFDIDVVRQEYGFVLEWN